MQEVLVILDNAYESAITPIPFMVHAHALLAANLHYRHFLPNRLISLSLSKCSKRAGQAASALPALFSQHHALVHVANGRARSSRKGKGLASA